jgi:Ser/Thr protein kinase RdoA (MazF antagonist)
VKTRAQQVCKQFTKATIKSVTALGNGLINDTSLVSTNNAPFVLQRINTQVFPEPGQIMENLEQLNKHIKNHHSKVELIIPGVLKTLAQQTYHIDKENNYWRAIDFIENTESKERIDRQEEAEQVGWALGHFHRLLCNANIELFHDTLPGFHITPNYFKQYQIVKKQQPERMRSEKAQQCKQIIASFRAKINSLENAKNAGLLTDRITHGDPKLNNFLFDKGTDKIISLIDLDTVKPGLIHYDIADCIRSCCHVEPSNAFDLALCKIILNSYLKETAVFFTCHDYEFLYPAIELIPFELGLRFFTDYLLGNQYFKVTSNEQNLDRALAQFQLCKNITEQEEQIKQIIADLELSPPIQ